MAPLWEGSELPLEPLVEVLQDLVVLFLKEHGNREHCEVSGEIRQDNVIAEKLTQVTAVS